MMFLEKSRQRYKLLQTPPVWATTSDFRHSDCLSGAKRVFLRDPYTQTFEIHGIDENWINVSILMADLIGDVVQPPAKIYPKIFALRCVFFGFGQDQKEKNGRNLIRWGFEGGEVITTQKWFGALLLLILP